MHAGAYYLLLFANREDAGIARRKRFSLPACAHDTSLMFAKNNHLFSERPPSEDEKALMQKAHEANVRGDAVTALFLFKECYQKTERFEARISVRSRCCNLRCDADCGPSVMPGAGR